MIDTEAIRTRFEALSPHLNERARRLFAASEAYAAGRGGIVAVSEVTGVARSTISRGLAELQCPEGPSSPRIRRPGGGRKPKTETEPGLLEALKDLVQSAIRGDPEAARLWVSKSQRHLARALAERGFTASQKLVGRLLHRLGRPFLMVGDLNTGNQQRDRVPGSSPYHCSTAFDGLVSEHGLVDLWRRTNGDLASEWTWFSNRGNTRNGFRLDHAFANKSFLDSWTIACRYDHRPRESSWTDHSAIKLSLMPHKAQMLSD